MTHLSLFVTLRSPFITTNQISTNGETVKENYYNILGIDRGADQEVIKRAYRKIALECHPDRHPGDPEAAAQFRAVAEAYATLSDPEKRATYDRGFRPIESLMDLLRQPLGRKLVVAILPVAPSAPKHGLDIVTTVTVSQEIFDHGGIVEVTNPRDPNQTFSLRVDVDYSWCCLAGLGEPNQRGGTDGDLYVQFLPPNA